MVRAFTTIRLKDIPLSTDIGLQKPRIRIKKGFRFHQAEARKAEKRVKIFQFDSKDNQGNKFNQDYFSPLAVDFFMWNNDVQVYLRPVKVSSNTIVSIKHCIFKRVKK